MPYDRKLAAMVAAAVLQDKLRRLYGEALAEPLPEQWIRLVQGCDSEAEPARRLH